MPLDESFYSQSIINFKNAFREIFSDTVVLKEEHCNFEFMGNFKLVFKLSFDDGSYAQFIGGLTYYAWYTSKEFDRLYPDTDVDYATYLAKELSERNIPVDIEDWDALTDALKYDSDIELVKEIQKILDE